MLLVIQKGGNFVLKATPPEDIVYMVCLMKQILQLELPFYFSDGHATDNLTTFYDSTFAADMPTIIDWEAVNAPYWGGTDNLNLKRKKQAELLLGADLPPKQLSVIGCYNNRASERLRKMGIDADKIKIGPSAYY